MDELFNSIEPPPFEPVYPMEPSLQYARNWISGDALVDAMCVHISKKCECYACPLGNFNWAFYITINEGRDLKYQFSVAIQEGYFHLMTVPKTTIHKSFYIADPKFDLAKICDDLVDEIGLCQTQT
jgi:hypothetical protein